MRAILVPAGLFARLSPALAQRGVVATIDEDAEHGAAIGHHRPSRDVPWLALAADEAGVIAALDNGAADAVTDCAMPELIAARGARLIRAGWLRVGELEIDPFARTAVRDGRPLALLPREYTLLLALARRAGMVVSRAELNRTIWGRGFDPGTNVIEVHVSRLRAELERHGPRILWTERRRGYRLAIAGDAAVA